MADQSIGDTVGKTLHPYMERAVVRVVDRVLGTRTCSRAIDRMTPEMVQLLYAILPGIGGMASDTLADLLPVSDNVAFYIQTLGSEAFKRAGDAIKEMHESGVELSDDMIDHVVDEAIKDAADMAVVVDPLGHFHLPDCVRLGPLNRRQKTEAKLGAALEQGLQPSPCCHGHIRAKLEHETKPKKEKPKLRKNSSPLDVLGLVDEEKRKEFKKWLKRLPAEQVDEVMEALQELDSLEEFDGLMALDPKMRLHVLPLLRNRNAASNGIKAFLAALGSAIKAGCRGTKEMLVTMWQRYREFDASLEPEVRQRIEDWNKPRERRPKKKVGWSLVEMLKPW